MRWRDLLAESVSLPRFYHGTCSAHLATIRQHGLRAVATTPKGGSIRHGIYLTDDLQHAYDYAELACDRLRDSDYHKDPSPPDYDLVALAITQLDPTRLQPDDYDLQDAIQGGEIAGSEGIDPRLTQYTRWDQVPWALSLVITHQVFYAGSIPPTQFLIIRP